MMASLFASCPTFLLSQLRPSFEKQDTFYPGCIAIWPLYDLFHHDASVWLRAGSHICHFCPMRILCCGWKAVTGPETQPCDAIWVALQSDLTLTAKIILLLIIIKHGQSLSRKRHCHFSWFVLFCWIESLWLSRCVCPTLRAAHF